MSTTADAKALLLASIVSLQGGVISSRAGVADKCDLVNNMMSQVGDGLTNSNSYDTHCQFYGKQRAILRGLAPSSTLFHSLGTPASYNSNGTKFTMPTTTLFGYQVYDSSGNPLTIANPALYYLTKNNSMGGLSSLVKDSGAYASPINQSGTQELFGIGNCDGAFTPWVALTAYVAGTQVVPIISNGYYYKCVQSGTSGSSAPAFPTVNGVTVTDGTAIWMCVAKNAGPWTSTTAYNVGDLVYPATPNGFFYVCSVAGVSGGSAPTFGVTIGGSTTDGGATWICAGENAYSHTCGADAIVAGSVVIKLDATTLATDDGAGNITGSSVLSGTVNYSTKVLNIVFKTPITFGQQLTITYTGIFALTSWLTKYSMVSFTLTSKTYGSSNQYTLTQIQIGGGVLTVAPPVMTMLTVRRVADHTVFGTMVVLVEGLKSNSSWNPVSDDPHTCTEVPDSEFILLMGYMNPSVQNNDVLKSSNPSNVSDGSGSPTYPNIEKNPFFPATDGTYTGDPPYPGLYAHIESSVQKWAVYTGYKFLYECTPAVVTVNPPLQNNPAYCTTAVAAINTITATPTAGNNPVPADTTSGSGGTRYTFNQKDDGTGTYSAPILVSTGDNLVYATVYDSGSGAFVSTGLLACVWNTLQTFYAQPGGGVLLNAQMASINTLGNFQNLITTSRWGGGTGVDPTFFNACATFKIPLQAWITYHAGFGNPKPGTGAGPTYSLTTWAALYTATHGVFDNQLAARFTDLDSVLGTDFVSGYTGKIYQACNTETNKTMGTLYQMNSQYNSISGMYSTMSQKQAAYAVYP
jgi:hypothetical protein